MNQRLTGSERSVETLVVGAGMSGLMAARQLRAQDRDVLVVDKGRGYGGRMAHRVLRDASFQHGAQFVQARHQRFAAVVAGWADLGLVEPADSLASRGKDQPLRWQAKPHISALARHLAAGIEVWLGQQIVSISPAPCCWLVALASGRTLRARRLLMTPPVPQTLALLKAGGVEVPSRLLASLQTIEYERCLTVMAVLSGPSRIPPPGMVTYSSGPIDRLCDQQKLGGSPLPAVTIQAGDAYSREHWDRPRDEVAVELLEMVQPWLGCETTGHQIHGWRYARPRQGMTQPCLVLQQDPPLVLAGDAFGGHDLEGAAQSGWAAADWFSGDD